MSKTKLFEIKVVSTEIFIGILLLINFIEIFFAFSLEDLLNKLGVFVISLIFTVLVIRSSLKEIKRREELEKLANKLAKASKELEGANKELQRLDDAKSEFLSIASHQLRTPLTVIRGYVSMMLEGSFGKLPKLIKENLTKVNTASVHLVDLIESLLNISRIEAGRIEFNIQPINLENSVKEIWDGFAKRAQDKKLKLEFFPDKKLPKVLADASKIKEVISNIIDNSIKYTLSGEISVGLHLEGASVVFSCQDTGIGIEPDDLPRLFNKFVRGKGMMQVYTEGTGLGMYFARLLVENMGGRIWVDSAGKGQGAKFSFSLPLADKKKVAKIRV
ncbi:MAG: HAMP domain-containing sensor histidine kinase [bacterium]